MKYRNDLTADYVRSILDYDPETGVFVWKRRLDVPKFVASRDDGKTAGTDTGTGYIAISIRGRLYKAHRLAVLVSTGSWPLGEVDHVNGNREDNRIANLRSVTPTENQQNQRGYKNNKSGHVGVCWHKRDKEWRSQIQVNGKQMLIGRFADKADAIAARQAASIKYGFHSNHGLDA